MTKSAAAKSPPIDEPETGTLAEFRRAMVEVRDNETRQSRLEERRTTAIATRDEARSTMRRILVSEAAANVSEAQRIIREAEEEIAALDEAIGELDTSRVISKERRDFLQTTLELEEAAGEDLALADRVDIIAAELAEGIRRIGEFALFLERTLENFPRLVTFEGSGSENQTYPQQLVSAILADALAAAYPPLFPNDHQARSSGGSYRGRRSIAERFLHLDRDRVSPTLLHGSGFEMPAALAADHAARALVTDPLRERAHKIVETRDLDPKRERTIVQVVLTGRIPYSDDAQPKREASVTVHGAPVGMTQRYL